MRTRNAASPDEPVLDMDEIQGMALPGFLKPHSTVVGFDLPTSSQELNHFRRALPTIAGELSTARETLYDRRNHRKHKKRGNTAESSAHVVALAGVGFNYPALRLLRPDARKINSPAFKMGLAVRSGLLGDPLDAQSEGHPANWIFGTDPKRATLLLVVAAGTRESADKRAEKMIGLFRSAGCTLCYRENGDVRSDIPGHEHFGFSDGISQPGIRGRASGKQADFITPRYIDPSHTPEAWLYGYPGQDLVWPGEFVLGYPASGPNPLEPGPTLACSPRWTRNGSFLVFRRLRQDVPLFWQTMRDGARLLSRLSGFSELKDVELASMLVGRWPSGAPLSRSARADKTQLGKNALANNHFRFDSDSFQLRLINNNKDEFRQAKADPVGFTCPGAAHIRKLNTRDSASDVGGREASYRGRILRTGYPFGPPLMRDLIFAPAHYDTTRGNRGLLFLCLQASIEGQFEFLQTRWLNNPSRPRLPGGHDLLAGQNPTPGECRIRHATIFDRNQEPADLSISAEWVIPTGGGYFFVPSIPAIKQHLANR